MLQRCSSNSTPFSILFPSSMEESASANYSSVDCTLSLGTPSSRHSAAAAAAAAAASPQRSSCSSTPSFCWDIITQSKTQQPNTTATAASRVPSAVASSSSSSLGGDPLLLARRCANCDTTSTPLWRNGPRGPKSLCNACGIRYKKEERRAAASTANLNDYQRQQQHPWSCYGTSSQSGTTTSPSSWCQNDDDMVGQVPYLSWRLNAVPPQFPVTDRPSLFQYQ